jgi:AcrR family transcriptional regulator
MTIDSDQRKNASGNRAYRSALRNEQAEVTRNRILEAAAEQLVDSSAGRFSVERVASKAGVSTGTVYHHFPNREALFTALDRWVTERYLPEAPETPADLHAVPDLVETVFRIFDEYETLVRAQLLSGAGQEARGVVRRRRGEAWERLVRALPVSQSEEQVRYATALVHHLVSSETWLALKLESGLNGEESGRAVAWALRTLISALDHGDPHIAEGGKQ